MSGNRKGALKGWCTKKGHIWPEKWRVELDGKIRWHKKSCRRCGRIEYKEGLQLIQSRLFRKRWKRMSENLYNTPNPLLERIGSFCKGGVSEPIRLALKNPLTSV